MKTKIQQNKLKLFLSIVLMLFGGVLVYSQVGGYLKSENSPTTSNNGETSFSGANKSGLEKEISKEETAHYSENEAEYNGDKILSRNDILKFAEENYIFQDLLNKSKINKKIIAFSDKIQDLFDQVETIDYSYKHISLLDDNTETYTVSHSIIMVYDNEETYKQIFKIIIYKKDGAILKETDIIEGYPSETILSSNLDYIGIVFNGEIADSKIENDSKVKSFEYYDLNNQKSIKKINQGGFGFTKIDDYFILNLIQNKDYYETVILNTKNGKLFSFNIKNKDANIVSINDNYTNLITNEGIKIVKQNLKLN